MNYRKMPDEILNILTDESISLIDRVRIADKGRSEGLYAVSTAINLLKIKSTTYHRYLRVVKSGNTEIYNRVATGNLTITSALDLLCAPDYPFRGRLEKIGANVLYISSRYVVYQYQNQCFLGVAYPDKESHCDCLKKEYTEQLYQIDNESYAIDTIIDLLREGYTIAYNLSVKNQRRENAGTLRHYIYAAYHKADITRILSSDVRFKTKKANGTVMDLRKENLRGPLEREIPPISGWTAVMRRGKDIVITRKVDGLVTYTDYSPELYRVLKGYGALHTKANDNRLCLYIDDKHDIYLYHLRMIEHLYGLPHDTEGLIANIERFRDEYMRQGMVIDHIDNDCTNDRLSNLMLMSLENNSAKSAIMRAIKKLGYPFFCWAERYDDTAITLQAGYFSQFKRPYYMVEGVFTVKQFLEEAQNFVDCAREECTIYDEFERLKRKEEEDQK